jgi:hypothetical protein
MDPQELAREVVVMAQREGTRLDLGGMQVVPSLDHVLGQIDAREATVLATLAQPFAQSRTN